MDKTTDFQIYRLGECKILSPMRSVRFIGDDEHFESGAAHVVMKFSLNSVTVIIMIL